MNGRFSSRIAKVKVAFLFTVFMSGFVQPGAGIAAPAAETFSVRPLAEVQRHDFVAVTAVEMAAADAKRAADGLPFRFALPVEMALTPGNSGTWEDLPDGRQLWRLRLASPGALSLNLGFPRWNLPYGAQMLIYPAGAPDAARSYDAAANPARGQLWTPVFLTDDLVVELQVAAADRDLVDLELGTLGRGYRFFGADPNDKSGACNIDVVCAEGDDWRGEIDTVGLVQRDGSTLCTGFMVNNTAADGRPLFMTAFHCFVDEDSAPTLVVYWNYQSPNCGAQAGGILDQTSSGSTLLAAYQPSDFTLLELDQSPDPTYGVKFAGWDRRDTVPASAVCIHHPSTDEKSISFENDPTSITTYLQTPVPGDGTHLRITDWDLGTTEGGSSGSPLFDAEHRVVGQLHGGQAACFNDLSDWYGRFFVSWTGGGSATSRLSDHLDPGATGAETTNLFDPLAASFTVAPTGAANATGVAGGPFAPVDFEYTLSNNGTLSVDYSVAVSTPWLSLDETGGTLVVSGQTTVTASLNASAATLAPGVHRATIEFLNAQGGGGTTTREVVLTVTENALVVLGPAPNPFSTPPVAIRYTLRGSAVVRATVTNLRGLRVRDLGRFAGNAGLNDIAWDGLDDAGHRVPSGVYVVAVRGLGHVFRVNVVYTH